MLIAGNAGKPQNIGQKMSLQILFDLEVLICLFTKLATTTSSGGL